MVCGIAGIPGITSLFQVGILESKTEKGGLGSSGLTSTQRKQKLGGERNHPSINHLGSATGGVTGMGKNKYRRHRSRQINIKLNRPTRHATFQKGVQYIAGVIEQE